MGKKENNKSTLNIIFAVVLLLLVAVLIFIIYKSAKAEPAKDDDQLGNTPPPTTTVPADETPDPTETPESTPDPTPEPTPFEPEALEFTQWDKYLTSTGIMVDGEIIDTSDYVNDTEISFGEGSEYTQVKGVTTFRGNNFRDGGAYGTANMTEKKFGNYWTVQTASLGAPDGEVWTGNGWTGQPLIVEWPKETREIMNMYDWAKTQDTLVEVIYPALDGFIYFMELETGKLTRDKLNIGYTFKGTGTIDPRGYPILYVGSGYNSYKGNSRVFVISLIDGSIMYEFGDSDSFALRPWPMFDSAPLVDAETDKLIYPGENGVVYIITLGTQFDPDEGTVSVSPTRTVKWRYESLRHASTVQYWLGFEASPVIWQGTMIIPDNGGHLICLDLNTLEVKWVQDILDDSNATPILSIEDGHPYIYVSTSFHYGWRSWTTADVPIWKIDAVTGYGVWRTDYECYTVDGLSGGVQGSPAIGKNNLDDLVFFPVARTPNGSAGLLVALDKETGEEVWNRQTNMYSWSSPTMVYDDNGDGYIIYTTTGHYIYILDGRTGEKLDSMKLGGLIEATPAVFNNYVVVGHRAQQIFGIELK